MIQIKKIQPEHVEPFWALRLEALRTNPEAFGNSYEDSAQMPQSEVLKMIKAEENHFVLGAFTVEEQLIGIVGFRRGQGIKIKHKGMIWGVYVSPEHRGCGIARLLLQEVLKKAGNMEGLKQINLSVVTINTAAVELYKKLGFRPYGIEKNAIEYNGQGYDEEYMTYYLS
ncbi:GNAT family N-acetyltransferase [Paenibacillus puldeungensis]|uniref:GNAT family N-acetyltransferase n=1 Tax=Paenibacillus puldeungensis TaxID=696536 RepID=A0ABW3S045_9BACL